MAAVDREKALDTALAQIERQFGKGSVMRLGDEARAPVEVIPTGAIALDVALGIGGLPRGRVVEIYGPESSGKCLTADTLVWTDRGLETVAEIFHRCGLPTGVAVRTTDVRDLGVRVVNERGELEPVHALTHNGRQPVVRVTFTSGRAVTVTANHPLRVLDTGGRLLWRAAGQLAVGDLLASALFGAEEAAGGWWSAAESAGPSLTEVSEAEATELGEQLGARYAASGGPGSAAGAEPVAAWGTAPDRGLPRLRLAGAKAQRTFLDALLDATDTAEGSPLVLAGLPEALARELQVLLYGLGTPVTLTGSDGDGWTLQGGAATSRAGRTVTVGGMGYRYEAVVAVTAVGEQPTFDLALPDTHSFLANGLLSHNTTVALHAVANAQRSGGIAAFIDAEHALDPDYARRLGVDTDALLVSQPDTGEQALEIADMLIRSGALDVIVIDSVAALVPRAEIEGEMGDSHVGLQARLMSQALRKLTGALSQSKTTAVFINQLREKVGVMFGSPETTTGGRALKFYASIRLDVRRIETLKDGTEAVGNRTRVKVVKNKMSPPFKQAEFDILYGQGISREGGLIDLGVEQGIVRKSGAWYTYDGDQLGQGKENARAFLRDNPDLADEIEKRIKEKLGIGPRIDVEAGPTVS